MKCGRVQWQEAEETRKDFNIVLIHQDKKFFTSERFKVIQDANPLIFHYRTMYQLRTISSSTFFTSDVQSIYTPSWIQNWYQEDKIWARDRRYSSRLWIKWTRNVKIWVKLTWMHRVLLGTSKKHEETSKHGVLGRHQICWKERMIWVLSDTIERNHLLRHAPSLLYPEGYHVGNSRNHLRESICFTSTSSKDFLETWLDERFGFRSCWRW